MDPVMNDYWDGVEKILQSYGVTEDRAKKLVSPYRATTDNIICDALKYFGMSAFSLGLYKRAKTAARREKLAARKGQNV